MIKKVLLFFLIFLFAFCSSVSALEGDRINLEIDEDGEISHFNGITGDGGDIEGYDDYLELEDGVLTIKQKAEYYIQSSTYEIEVKQNTNDIIGLSMWSDGDLTLTNVKAIGSFLTANGEFVFNNSNITINGMNREEGSINAEEDIIINNSTIACNNSATNNEEDYYTTSYGNIHSYYGDIKIKESNVRVEGRLYVDDGSISISNSDLYLDEEWGYLVAPTDVVISNSNVTFLFGIEAGESMKIQDSTINAYDKESVYAREANDKNQGWIQVSDGDLTIINSHINVINSITSTTDMLINNSNLTLSGKYSNNGYVQSSNGKMTIKDSEIIADKDVWSYGDLEVNHSDITINANNSNKGYLESHEGKIDIKDSNIRVDEGIVSESNISLNNSDVRANGTKSNRGYIESHNGNLDIISSLVNTNEHINAKGKTTINDSNVNLKSGIITKGLDIIKSKFYASNNNTSINFSNLPPIISLDKLLIEDSNFISESISNVPSIASLDEIAVINNDFINKSNNTLEVIKVVASEENFINNESSEYIAEGSEIYTTALDGAISNYSALKVKEDVVNPDDKIVNPETGSNNVLIAFLVLLVSIAIFFTVNKETFL